MADSYYDNQTHSPSPNGEQYSNGETHPSERIASPNGGGVSPNGYPADGGVESAPAAVAPARKKLSSWVGFSNLPNQVHRRSVRWVRCDKLGGRYACFATSGWISHCNIIIDYKLMLSLGEVSSSWPWLSVSCAQTCIRRYGWPHYRWIRSW